MGYVSAVDSKVRTIWIADAHRDDGRRFVVRTDEKLTAFMELEVAVYEFALDLSFRVRQIVNGFHSGFRLGCALKVRPGSSPREELDPRQHR